MRVVSTAAIVDGMPDVRLRLDIEVEVIGVGGQQPTGRDRLIGRIGFFNDRKRRKRHIAELHLAPSVDSGRSL